jgi:hypothetical protein
MNIREIRVLASNRKAGTKSETLCRIETDPPGRNYAVWNNGLCRFTERGLARHQAQEWCRENRLSDATEGR